jgi:hypothetical protein
MNEVLAAQHRYRLCDSSNLQRGGHVDLVSDLNDDVLALERRETCRRDLDGVGPGNQIGNRVVALGVGSGFGYDVGIDPDCP